MHPCIRRAVKSDLLFVFQLERTLFPPERRESYRSLGRSLVSPHQEVWLALDGCQSPLAAMLLRLNRRILRIYSLGVLPHEQGKGVGRQLLNWAEERARVNRCAQLVLEVDSSDERLLRIYQELGFRSHRRLSDYYGTQCDGIRMMKSLDSKLASR